MGLVASVGPHRVLEFLNGPHEAPPGPGEVPEAGSPAPPALSSSHISPFDLNPDLPVIAYAKGGQFVRVKIPGPGPVSGGRRAAVREFSRASRRRLLERVNSIDQEVTRPGEFVFVTLTYPEAFPAARASKRDLDTFIKRMERAWGRCWVVWKLEPQRRGAPHYHLLVYMPSIDVGQLLAWAAPAWHEIAGQDDPNHLAFHLGKFTGRPCVEVVKDWKAVAMYCGKYLGKIITGDEEWQHPGRYWGERRSDLAPITIVRRNVTQHTAILLRRACVRHFEHQPAQRFYLTGRQRKNGGHEPGRVVYADHKVDFTGMGECDGCSNNRERNAAGVPLHLVQLAEVLGCEVRPQPRSWPSTKGGFSGFISAATFARYEAWAEESAKKRIPRPRLMPGLKVPACFCH